MSDKKTESAEAVEIEVSDMDELLGTKASVVISADEESKKSVLSNSNTDMSFLDKDLEGPKDEEKTEEDPDGDDSDKKVEEKPKDELSNILDDNIEGSDSDIDEDDSKSNQKNKGGRKPALVEAMNKLIEKNTISLFEDTQNLEEYTTDDIVELIETNMAEKVNQAAQAAPMEIFNRLDPKLQDVVAYALNGGQDITNVLKTVAITQEFGDLDVENEKDQEKIVREWLQSIDYGDDSAIEDEVLSLIDRGEIKKKAEQFKPKLDKKRDEILKKKLDEQEAKKEQAKKASEKYAQVIHNHLNQSHLNGLQLNNKVQTMLYYGLTETQYQDRNGNPTNALGHLIEEYQFGENANPSVLLEALWLLADPQGYRNSVSNLVEKSSTSKTVRALKTAEATTTTSSQKQGSGETRGTGKRKTVKRQTGSRSIFQRD